MACAAPWHRENRAHDRGAHIEDIDGCGDVVLVVLDRLLATLADGLVRGDVNDAEDAAIVGVVLEDAIDVLGVSDIALEELDLGVGLVLVRSVGTERIKGQLRDALACFGERVVEAAVR
jgi:hypothetical protein